MRLFKYFPPERTDVLENGFIRFSPVDELNDLFEMSPPCVLFDSLDEVRRYFRDTAQEDAERLNEAHLKFGHKPIPISEFVRDSMTALELDIGKLGERHYLKIHQHQAQRDLKAYIRKFGTLCLTTHACNLTMWAHYAASHTGFVMEFDGEHPFFGNHPNAGPFEALRQVSYQSTRPALRVGVPGMLTTWLSTKSPDWEYEEEWRCMKLLQNADKNTPATGLFLWPVEALKSVRLGARMRLEPRERIFQALQKLDLPDDFTYWQAHPDPRDFKLYFQPLDNPQAKK